MSGVYVPTPPWSLKTLDPGGSVDKWMQHVAKTATSGRETVRNIPTGKVMEVIAPMAKAGGGTLNIGVRLFQANGASAWRLTAVLTRQ